MTQKVEYNSPEPVQNVCTYLELQDTIPSFSFFPDEGGPIEVCNVEIILTTTATVGNRQLSVSIFGPAGTKVWSGYSPVVQPASKSWRYECLPGGGLYNFSTVNLVAIGLP